MVQRLKRIGRNNARLHEIREQRKALKDKLDTLDDANTDLMMDEGDNVQLFIGESFVKSSEETAQEYVEKRVEEANMEMNKLEEEESMLEARQSLRKLLIGESFVRYSLDDDDDFEVPSVLQSAANLDDDEEEDEPQVAAKTNVTNYLQFCLDCLQSPA
ncbi:hypothetical protein PsorP6_011713 [Peronosclerospora sorghi]|uniref:Uncharacterized protein n=1 Tax=Peronosclerospora sorghi TaxID=230839 RepID=A0ACC0WJR1_9STRA|nr:hypothetical protein PsorP6_011713 [Peronosclerospora sorghi]